MKKIVIILLSFVAFLTAGCKKFLDEKPQTEIGASEFWKSEDDIKSGLAAMYDGIQSCFDNDFTLWGDARSDEVWRTQYGVDDHVLNALSATSSGTDWSNFYTTIYRANLAIKNIPIIKSTYQTGLDQKLVNHYLSQAYAVRGFCYFWIVRLWGAAPLWLEPYSNINQEVNKSRTPSDVLLDSIYSDLQKAAVLSDPKSGNVFEVTTGAIYSMLMDVSMWRHDYPAAVNWFNKLEGLKKYSIEPAATWKNLFTDPASTKESIWSVYWDWTVDGGANVSTLIGAGNTNSDFSAEDSVWNYFTTTPLDIRGPQTIDFSVSNHDKFNKFYAPTGTKQLYPNSSEANILFPLYRLADIYLLRAEAANKLSDPQNALKYLNIIHQRAGLTAYSDTTFADTTSMENAILEERKLELYMEAKRWFDLVRTGKVAEVMDPYLKARQFLRNSPQIGFGDIRKVLWPLNRNVLNSNPLLVQNPPY